MKLPFFLVVAIIGGAPPAMLAQEALWKAGVARAVITPSQPVWMAGYGGKERPPEGKVMDLWIKVLALEDALKEW